MGVERGKFDKVPESAKLSAKIVEEQEERAKKIEKERFEGDVTKAIEYFKGDPEKLRHEVERCHWEFIKAKNAVDGVDEATKVLKLSNSNDANKILNFMKEEVNYTAHKFNLISDVALRLGVKVEDRVKEKATDK